jgi:hypothetical protein
MSIHRAAWFSVRRGSGFLVSTNGGAANPTLFGFPGDFQAFSAQKLFTAVNSNITDVTFFVPGTTLAATTSAFGAVFVDVESAGLSRMEFFDDSDALIYARDVLVAGNQGLSFLGAVATGGEKISRVRLTSGLNTIVANGLLGNPNDDVVVMDDFLYAEPSRARPGAFRACAGRSRSGLRPDRATSAPAGGLSGGSSDPAGWAAPPRPAGDPLRRAILDVLDHQLRRLHAVEVVDCQSVGGTDMVARRHPEVELDRLELLHPLAQP